MIILGFDPGTRRTGYAVLEFRAMQPHLLDLGAWRLSEKEALGLRLEELHTQACELLRRYNPHVVGLEKAVTFKNVASSLKLSEARGVLRLATQQILAKADERVIELSPTAVKRQAAGLGLASKMDVTRVLRLRFPDLARFAGNAALLPDAYDALAIAWTAAIEARSPLRLRKRLAELPG